MTTNDVNDREPVDPDRRLMYDAARKLLLASIGAVALAQDEIEGFVNKLVDRGEIAEKDGRELLHKITERGRDMAKKATTSRSTQMEEVIRSMDIPTRADIKALSNKIAALAKKIDELKQG